MVNVFGVEGGESREQGKQTWVKPDNRDKRQPENREDRGPRMLSRRKVLLVFHVSRLKSEAPEF